MSIMVYENNMNNKNRWAGCQKIPKKIVKSSYPIWLFNEEEFRNIFKKRYKEIATFDALDGVMGYGRLKAKYKGIIYKKN